MKYKLLRFSLLSMLVMLFGGVSSVWADDTKGTIKFGTNDVKINSSTVTGNDNLENTWTITTDGTSSFTTNAAYYQVGSSTSPATSITFTTTLPEEVNITSLSAKFGGYSSTAGDVSLKVDDTVVGSGSLNASNDVTVESTKSETGKVLTVSVTNIAKGVKCYYISYTYNDETDQRVKTSIVFADGYATEGMEGTTIALPTATVKDASGNTIDGAAITWSSSNEEVATINGNEINLLTQGTSVIKATYAGDETAYRGSENSYTLNVTETDQIANPYVYVFDKKTFEDANNLTKKLKNVTWTVETDTEYFGYDTDANTNTNRGQQFGSGKNPAKYLKVKLSYIPGTITSVKINTSGAKDTNASFSIKVGDSDFNTGEATTATLTKDATNYEFTGSASGNVVISYTQTSSTAIYIKSVEITYTEEAEEGWRDIHIDLTNGNLLEESEQVQWGTINPFGIAVDKDGAVSRVAADAADSRATVQGKWHSNQCWASLNVSVNVEGPVKVTCGTQPWSDSPATIKVGNETVASFSNKGTLWTSGNKDNVVIGYYKGSEPATLTIDGGGYPTYIAIEKVDPADIPNDAKVTFDASSAGAEGIAPAEITAEIGSTFKIPANTSLYIEGKTLTAWTDGTAEYKIGNEITVNADMTLTPVFTANTVSFADRTAEVTALWDFQQKNGAVAQGIEGKTGIVVTQITIGNEAIDFPLNIDATAGKYNNKSWQDWAQINNGTLLKLPAYKGTAYSTFSMNDNSSTTFNDEASTYADNVNTYTYEGSSEEMTINIQGGTYYRWLKAIYPAPEQQEEPTESVLYSWDAGTEDGGTAVASDDQSVGYANAGNTTIRLNGANDFSTNTVTITLDKALSAGDKIAITAYRNKNASDKPSGVKMKFEKGETTVGCETGYEYVNIDTSDASANDPNRGTDPNTITFTVPTVAEGSKTITLTRSHQSTNLFITKLVVTTTSEGGDEPEDPTGFTFRDFNTELYPLTQNDEEGATVTFGLSVAEDGTVSRVAADAENTAAVVTGKTGNDHGLQNFSATVPVEGAVKITMGTCSWGSEVTVKNAAGETVATFTTQKGENGTGCYGGNKFDDENIVSAKYVGDATTLAISGGGYVNFFAVEAIEASSVDVAYSLGEVECEGDILPTGGTFAAGDEYTIPANNFTLYKEGYTLTGWSDGKNTYGVGSKITLSESITLTPVFTQNEVSLADRTEPVTVKWNFRRDQGAPTVAFQNATGVWVTQVTVNGKTIDVKADFDTNNGGKFANGSWNDWAQLNNGTKWTIPSCKGATISIEAFSELGAEGKIATTIDGQSDYTSAKTISYEIGGSAEAVDVVIGNDGSYYRYIQTVLPVVQSAGGETFDNVDVLVEWPFDKHPAAGEDYTVTKTPEKAIGIASFEILGDLSKSSKVTNPLGTGAREKDPDNGLKFITFCGESNMQLHWFVKPTKGLTLTPTQIKMYVQRFGTNKENGVVVTAKKEGGEVTTLGTYTARRANWTTEQENAQFGWTEAPATLVNEVVIDLTAEQQATLASGEGFHLYAVTGLGNEKFGGFADIRIAGKVDGTAASVEMFTLAAVASPEEGGSVSKYPNADEYEAGTEVTLTATENFGYDFVNWTNAAGEEVSTEAKFKYTVNSNETLTANFKAVETYELALTVDGTNDYMVTVSPAPDVVDGKWMYEAGTAVQLTANQYEGLVTFTNWSDSETASNKIVKMDSNVTLTAIYTEADIIAGWDFYKAGNNGRKADFAAQDNEADALSLVNTETGETSGWLDKSTLGGGGYEGFKGAAVNWRQGTKYGDVGNYHWQTKVNAEAFTDINVQFQMLYNYNAYQTYDAEYSLDGENWTKFGSITMEGAKKAASFSGKLPADCNNQKDLFIRMKADKTSKVDGTASQNDGNALAMFFITGTPKIDDDGTAPVLVSTVPADNATGVSASGKIVLTFDERVKVVEGTVAYLNNSNIKSVTQNPMSPTVSGKVITFEYKGLDYGTKYNFVLAGKTVGDLTDNMIQNAIEFSFNTMERPTVDKKLYDAVVDNVDQLLAAISEAQSRSDKNVRYRIFIKNGEYTIPLSSTTKTCNGYDVPECITFINTSNLSIIGESRDDVIITNGIDPKDTFASTYGTTSKYDGIGNSDVFQLSGSDYYFQDLTVESGMDDATGRDLAIQDKATRTIYKNTGLRGYQDTWTSNNDNGLYYFEDGYLRGRTDYMCGKGDAFFNGVELRQIAGGYAAVPSKSIKYGFTYKDCVINGEGDNVDGNYTLGRPWGQGTPVALWIDTKMNVVPSAIGWNEMSGGWPARFAEYNSMTSTGSVIDLSGRKKTFGDGHANNPVLTAEEAAEAGNLRNMFGEWDPTLATEQAPIVQDVKLTGNELSWTGSNYALLYAIVKDGKVIDFTTETSYDISTAATSRRAGETAKYQIRAANEMGGLNEASEVATATDGIETVNDNVNVNLNDNIYNLQGIRVNKAQKGVYIIGGRKVVIK